MHCRRRRVVLNGGDLAVALHAIAELRGKGVGQQLVAAFDMKDCPLEHRQSTHLRNRGLPDAEQSRRIANVFLVWLAAPRADETHRRLGETIVCQYIAEQLM